MTDVFKTENSPNPEAPAVSGDDPVAALVGDGKKFKTVADLAKGKIEADAFIESLKREQAELRTELEKTSARDDQLAALRAEIAELRNARPQPSRDNTNPQLTAESVRNLVTETITQAERNRTAQQNITAANDAVVKHFGTLDAAQKAVQTKAAELGMDMADLRNIAAKSPSAFQKIMIGEQVRNSEQAPLTPKITTPDRQNPQGAAPQPGTKEYFEAIRTQDRKRYFSPEVQKQLHAAVKAGTYVDSRIGNL